MVFEALFAMSTSGAVLYVDLNSADPTPPYASWGTAAPSIQDAIDVSSGGDLILVTNGIYRTGGRTVNGYALTNRVVIDKSVTVESVNGPEVTVIQGNGVLGTNAIRCVYLTNGAVLAGFTITNGTTRANGDFDHESSGGGVWCESFEGIITNCVLTGNRALVSGGGAYSGTLSNCTLSNNAVEMSNSGGGAYSSRLSHSTLSGNSAFLGGGAAYCTLNYCVLTGNSAASGGGAVNSTLNHCTLTGNSCSEYGGAADFSTLNDCALEGNTASGGGGSSRGTLNRCTLSGNSAVWGGGSFGDKLMSCSVTGNSASQTGGGVNTFLNYTVVLVNCTLTGNHASLSGGAIYADSSTSVTITNCTIVGNTTSAGNDGGIVSGGYFLNGTVVMNSIIAGNTGGDVDCLPGPDNSFSSAGHNLIGTGNAVAAFNQPGDVTNTSPLLSPLGDYGGPTATMPPLVGSLAIDAGDDSVTNFLATDQRGLPRLAGSHVDIGAVEVQWIAPSKANRPVLTNAVWFPVGHTFMFSFTNVPGVSFTVLSTTNLTERLTNWTILGSATEISPGQYQFIDTETTNVQKRFYRVSSP